MSNSPWIVRDTNRETEKPCDSRQEAEERKDDVVALGAHPDDIEIIAPEETDGGQDIEAEIVDHTEAEPVTADELSQDPIGFLESVNPDFVNTIKGKPAISKQGFRFIQREFEITTESDVVELIDEPLGCIVWAKAELPNGHAAEAHGEGYQFETDVSDNEFVRYADTRAKNRALSDLTSAGALAVSELTTDD